MKSNLKKDGANESITKTAEFKVKNEDNEKSKEAKDIKNGTAKNDFDTLLPFAGEFGLYQFLIFLSTMPFYAYGVFVYFSQIFITEVSQNHWCRIPELENLTVTARRNLAIPRDEGSKFGYSRCSSFVADWREVLKTGEQPNNNWKIEPCKYGWEFNSSEIPYPTISSELGWVCEKSGYQAIAQSVFFVGAICGLALIGWIADRFGRISAIVVCNTIGCIGGVATIFATNLTEFAVCRFVLGMSYDNCEMITFLLVLEYVGPKYRTFISNFSFAIFFTLAAVSLPWIALASGHWKTICLATSFPLALALFTPLLLQESPRWLLSRGKVDEVIKNILTIGRINKKTVPMKEIQKFKDTVNKTEVSNNGNILEVFRRPVMRRLFLLNCLAHICCDMAIDTSFRILGSLKFDFFLSFTLVSLMELPASITTAFLLDPIGRRWMMFSMNFMTGVFYLLTVFVGNATLSIVLIVFVRFCISLSYTATYQWGAELLPTPVRGSGVSACHMSAFTCTMLAQYVLYLGVHTVWLPLVTAAVMCFIGALVALLLPETTGKEMPQTFEDAEELYTNQRFTEVPWWPKRSKYVMNDNLAYQ